MSRASYYRFVGSEAEDPDMELRSVVQKIALSQPSYGYRRVQAELRRRGHQVNHKRVRRLMREDNLLCLRRRSFVRTTDSRHGFTVYPNLAKEMVLTDINQLWVADITYIRLSSEFVYLAVILDAYSRRVVGWSIDGSQTAALVTNALGMAIDNRSPQAGTILHSDHGAQFTSWAFTERARQSGLVPSMGSVGDCYDNALIEAFWSRMQVELLDTRRWKTRVELANAIFEYIEIFHNRRRRHSSLGMLTPIEFELKNINTTPVAA